MPASGLTQLIHTIDLSRIRDTTSQQDSHAAIEDAIRLLRERVNASTLALMRLGGSTGAASVNTILTADPVAPADDTWWITRTGAGPYDIDLHVRIAGVTTTFPLGST